MSAFMSISRVLFSPSSSHQLDFHYHYEHCWCFPVISLKVQDEVTQKLILWRPKLAKNTFLWVRLGIGVGKVGTYRELEFKKILY